MRPRTALAMCLALALGASLSAADYWVSVSGNDADPGTFARPWRTLSAATARLLPGDTLWLRGGVWSERVALNAQNTPLGARITIRNQPGEVPILDGTAIAVPQNSAVEAMLHLRNCHRITVRGIEIRNFRTTSRLAIPVGILVSDFGDGIEIRECRVHHIEQNSVEQDSNGFGIAVYGTTTRPIRDLVIADNEVSHLRTGRSESVALNGNVMKFLVSGNHIHDCNNIGVDFIGYEGSAPTGVDRARHGVCRGNVVHHIDSLTNPGYQFERAAAGIYVDGGHSIVIEQNDVFECNYGIEIASEHQGQATERVIVSNNLVHHNHLSGIGLGGADPTNGGTVACVVRNNVLYRNDSDRSYSGQLTFQFHCEDNRILNNSIWVDDSTGVAVVHYTNRGPTSARVWSTTNRFEHNLYFGDFVTRGSIEFELNLAGSGQTTLIGLDAWQSAVSSDAKSLFADPQFLGGRPGPLAPTSAYRIQPTSPCRNRGQPTKSVRPTPSETDFFGNPRFAEGRIDVGIHEKTDGT